MSQLFSNPVTPIRRKNGVPTADEEALQEPTIDPVFTLAGALTGGAGIAALRAAEERELTEGITPELLEHWYGLKLKPGATIEGLKNNPIQKELVETIERHIADRISWLKDQRTIANRLKDVAGSVPSTMSSQYIGSKLTPKHKTASNVGATAQIPNPDSTRRLFDLFREAASEGE